MSDQLFKTISYTYRKKQVTFTFSSTFTMGPSMKYCKELIARLSHLRRFVLDYNFYDAQEPIKGRNVLKLEGRFSGIDYSYSGEYSGIPSEYPWKYDMLDESCICTPPYHQITGFIHNDENPENRSELSGRHLMGMAFDKMSLSCDIDPFPANKVKNQTAKEDYLEMLRDTVEEDYTNEFYELFVDRIEDPSKDNPFNHTESDLEYIYLYRLMALCTRGDNVAVIDNASTHIRPTLFLEFLRYIDQFKEYKTKQFILFIDDTAFHLCDGYKSNVKIPYITVEFLA